MQNSTGGRYLLILSLAWIALIAYQAWLHWPFLPLDVDAANQDVIAAHRSAIVYHVSRAILWGITPPVGALLLSSLFRRGTEQQSPAARLPPTPARILLMRHAEKPGDVTDIHLSPEGRERALSLATYIPETFGLPAAIFAASRSKHSDRSVETVEPLARGIGVPIRRYDDDDYQAMLADLTQNAELSGKTVVICWHHSDLPRIARALGALTGTYPDPWPSDVFNLILDLQVSASGLATAQQIIEPF